MEGLRNNPQISELRNTVMQNPAFLQPMIQQIAQANPGLAEHLAQNPEALLQLLGTLGGDGAFDDGEGEGGEGGSSSGGQVLQVTPEERAAIERVRTLCMLPSSVMLILVLTFALTQLEALGFPRHLVVEAYFACDKNEELAANYLFESGFDDQ